jgi:hypothetical protein
VCLYYLISSSGKKHTDEDDEYEAMDDNPHSEGVFNPSDLILPHGPATAVGSGGNPPEIVVYDHQNSLRQLHQIKTHMTELRRQLQLNEDNRNAGLVTQLAAYENHQSFVANLHYLQGRELEFINRMQDVETKFTESFVKTSQKKTSRQI